MGRKREHRVLLMVITMVVCYLLCWLPYGIMALMATFGDPDLITAEASIVPSLLAKTSTVINPIIYIFMNKQFIALITPSLKLSGTRLGRERVGQIRGCRVHSHCQGTFYLYSHIKAPTGQLKSGLIRP
ncbi:hypothetical protein SRHO_G00237610 [Serrasalmus rhombeus]